MKRKLKWIILSIPLLAAAIIACTILLRYRSSGPVVATMVRSDYDTGTQLVQIRRRGVRLTDLSDRVNSNPVFSPNGRYVACLTHRHDQWQGTLFDLLEGGRVVLFVDGEPDALQPTDDGRLLYVEGGLYLADGNGRLLLDADCLLNTPLQLDGSHLYYVAQQELRRVNLTGGEPETLLSHVEADYFQMAQNELGQAVLCITRKEQSSTRTLLRWTEGETQVLVRGIPYTAFPYSDIYCQPLNGIVIYRLPGDSRFSYNRNRWFCAVNGTSTELTELQGDYPHVVITPGGQVLLANDFRLFYRRVEDGVLSGARQLTDRLSRRDSFTALRDADGTLRLYYLAKSTLYRSEEDGWHAVTEGVKDVYFPCRNLPDGTKQRLGEGFYLTRREATDRLAAKPSEITLSTFAPTLATGYTPGTIHLSWQENGEETQLLTINNSPCVAHAILPDGSLLAMANNVFWVLGPDRVERLSLHADYLHVPEPYCPVTLHEP